MVCAHCHSLNHILKNDGPGRTHKKAALYWIIKHSLILAPAILAILKMANHFGILGCQMSQGDIIATRPQAHDLKGLSKTESSECRLTYQMGFHLLSRPQAHDLLL